MGRELSEEGTLRGGNCQKKGGEGTVRGGNSEGRELSSEELRGGNCHRRECG